MMFEEIIKYTLGTALALALLASSINVAKDTENTAKKINEQALVRASQVFSGTANNNNP